MRRGTRPGSAGWARTLGWVLQFLALVVVGSALLVGLFYDAVRTEIGMLAVGGLMFLVGRKLNSD